MANYKYISFGRNCDIRASIETYFGKQETHFFDWLRTDFQCISKILAMKDIETELLYKSNFHIDKEMYARDNNICITFENFKQDKLCCMAHHDMRHTDENGVNLELEPQLNDFIQKYKRRHKRLIDFIKTSQQKCIFIHRLSNPENFQKEEPNVNQLLETILSINPSFVFCFVLLVDTEEDYTFIKKQNYLKINYHLLKNEGWKIEWRSQFIKWQEVFDIIRQHAF
jgi:hypothetical protein